MNWFSVRGRNKTIQDKKMQAIRKKLVISDKLKEYDYVLKKVSEIDVMKKCLFKESQIQCFEFLDKPQSLNMDNILYKNLFTTKEERRKELIETFSLELYENRNYINFTLFSMLEESVRKDIETRFEKNG
jgi:hypothetical protein